VRSHSSPLPVISCAPTPAIALPLSLTRSRVTRRSSFIASPQDAATGGAAFKAISFHKWRIAAAALDAGVDVALSDVDAVPLRNPFSYIETLPRCDVYFTADATNLFAADDAWYPAGERYWWQSLGVRWLPGWVPRNRVNTGVGVVADGWRLIR
jgi:hypothetical protein